MVLGLNLSAMTSRTFIILHTLWILALRRRHYLFSLFLDFWTFGLLGGIGGHVEDLMHMKRTADRLFGDDYQWSILGAGRNQFPLASVGLAQGSNVRVGLEDSLWIAPGELAKTNADQVSKIRTILDGLSLDVATPDEARVMLQLKGVDHVVF